jgi:threonine/homoserine/homoserine lactone efflux protein
MLLVTWAAWHGKGLPQRLNYLGLVVGVVGLISAVPGLNDVTGLFGMSQMLWFIWLGIVLLRSKPSAAAEADVRRQDDARRAAWTPKTR